MRPKAKAIIPFFIVALAAPLFVGSALAASGDPCVVRECTTWIGYQTAEDQPVVHQCTSWKTTPTVCATGAKPDVTARDIMRPSKYPIGGPSHRP